jgi:hypothetical protein
MKHGLSDLDRLISRIQPVQKEETVYDARTVVQKLLDNGFISVDELCDHFCGDGEIHLLETSVDAKVSDRMGQTFEHIKKYLQNCGPYGYIYMCFFYPAEYPLQIDELCSFMGQIHSFGDNLYNDEFYLFHNHQISKKIQKTIVWNAVPISKSSKLRTTVLM